MVARQAAADLVVLTVEVATVASVEEGVEGKATSALGDGAEVGMAVVAPEGGSRAVGRGEEVR